MKLTPTETKVIDKLVLGLSNKEIASALNLSNHTVKFHMVRMTKRFRMNRVGLAVAWTKLTMLGDTHPMA